MDLTYVPSPENVSGQLGTGSNTNINTLQANATVELTPVPHPGEADDE